MQRCAFSSGSPPRLKGTQEVNGSIRCWMYPVFQRQATRNVPEEIPGEYRVNLGADKGYDTGSFVQELRDVPEQDSPSRSRPIQEGNR
jgi:hypothetical protein